MRFNLKDNNYTKAPPVKLILFQLDSDWQMLTTQQAADILNVPRPYLSKLLKDGEIPYVSSGSGQRVTRKDLMVYKKKRDALRAKVLDDLTRRGQEFDAA